MSNTAQHVAVAPSLTTKRAVWFASSYARVFSGSLLRRSAASSVLSGIDAKKDAMAVGSSRRAVETRILRSSLMASQCSAWARDTRVSQNPILLPVRRTRGVIITPSPRHSKSCGMSRQDSRGQLQKIRAREWREDGQHRAARYPPAWLRRPANPLTNRQKNPTPGDVILASTDVSNWCFGAGALESATFCGGNTTFG